MELKFIYFGMIAEMLGKTDEIIVVNEECKNLRTFILQHYPELNKMSFSLAINQEIRDEIKEGEKISEIALLPPFAGG